MRHRVGHDRLDVLSAVFAIIAMERVLGDHRCDLLGDVLDDPRADALAALVFV